ncbi:MAG: glycosyltransferase family 4 protein [Bacteroidales bacterium]
MRIAVNTRLLLKNRLEGIGWYTYETLKRITTNHPEHEYFFLFDRKPDPSFIFSNSITPIVLHPQARHPILWYLWFEFSVTKFLKKNKIDLFLSPDGYIPLKTNTPTLAAIHDINFHHHPEGVPWKFRTYFNHFFPKFAQRATRLVTVSEYSKNDISTSYKIDADKIDVTYNGANTEYIPITNEEKLAVKNKYTNGKLYFVFVGALNPRKNVARLLKAFDLFSEQGNDYHLVIVGEPMFLTKEIEDTLKSMKNRQSVVFTGRLNVNELRMVLGAATALTFVPYFEGFGIPMVEAMNCGVPIIASNRTSMPEVAGDAAYYVDPYNVESIAQAMSLLATDNRLRDALVAEANKRKNMFSWDKTAEKLYESMLKTVKHTV